MGNVVNLRKRPSEYNGVICKCGRSLPPCKTWSQFCEQYICRGADTVNAYVFLGGKYYRIKGYSIYYCNACFWEPQTTIKVQQEKIEDQRRIEMMQRHQRRVEEEQRNLEERARSIRLMMEMEQRKKEMARRKEEAQREAEKQNRLKLEELERRLQEKKAIEHEKEKQKREIEYKLSHDMTEEDHFNSWIWKKEKDKVRQVVEIQTHQRDFSPTTYHQPTECVQQFVETIENKGIMSECEEACIATDLEEDVEEVLAAVKEIQISDEQSVQKQWLEFAQTRFILWYCQARHLTTLEKQSITDSLVNIRMHLSIGDLLSLTKVMGHLIENLDCYTTVDIDETSKFLILLMECGISLGFYDNVFLKNCLHALVSVILKDPEFQAMFIQPSPKWWTIQERFYFMRLLYQYKISTDSLKTIYNLTQSYSVPYQVVRDIFEETQGQIEKSLVKYVRNEPTLDLDTILLEIERSELLQSEIVDRNVMQEVKKSLMLVHEMSGEFDLDYKKYLSPEAISNAKSCLINLREGVTKSIALTIATLACAVKNTRPFFPHETQLVALAILIFSSSKSVNRLLEVLTGEGKSCVIAMFATALGMQGKHVDIITSSPILACRDSEDWKQFYSTFDLTVSHNTDFNKVSTDSERDADDVRRKCYENRILYGTVSSFAADVLREEFQRKNIRCGRRFDVVIADEADLLLLDEGVKFTYLSHDAAFLHHMEPVIASVWGVVGQYRPLKTLSGSVLYARDPHPVFEAIFEMISSEGHFDDEIDIIELAAGANLINNELRLKLVEEGSYEEKIEAMKCINTSTMIEILQVVGRYTNIYITPHEIGQDGELYLKPKEYISNILIFDQGFASALYSCDRLAKGAVEKVQGAIEFSSKEEGYSDSEMLIVPQFLKEFVTHQLPVCVVSALQCLQMAEDREYTIRDGRIIPVDFQNSGILEVNKKWGAGLQQMLEMKHGLCLSPMSVVTNFMSHIELFSRYKYSGIYGLSGTLGTECSATKQLLMKLLNVRVAHIPCHRRLKIFEKEAIIVNGSREDWFSEIMKAVFDAAEPKPWKGKGRAVLILCEDIRTAEHLRNYILQKRLAKYTDKTVKLYAYSSSDETKTINHTMKPGEIIIATNLAGRGTDIKVTDRVNQSGGLFCILTFLARNRRVELQAFGRTARNGEPGSAQCIIRAASLPQHYRNCNIESMRKLREDAENVRITAMMKWDIKQVQCKESLFQKHCLILENVYKVLGPRDDVKIIIECLNEVWGQWLQMKNEEILSENCNEARLHSELDAQHRNWKSLMNAHCDVLSLPFINYYHLIKFANNLLISLKKENLARAHRYYGKSIELEPRYAFIAHYNRAFCTIMMKGTDYKNEALKDLESASNTLVNYMSDVTYVSQCVNILMRKDGNQESGIDEGFAAQMKTRIQILHFLANNMEESIKLIQEMKESDNIAPNPIGIFSLIPSQNSTTNRELYGLWNQGLEVAFSLKVKPAFCWSAAVVCTLGVVELVTGVVLCVCTSGTAASVGMILIMEGISDCIDGTIGMWKREFNWKLWGIGKAAGLTLSICSGGISRVLTKVTKVGQVVKVFNQVGKEIRAACKAVNVGYSKCMKSNIKHVLMYVGKEFVEQAAMQGISLIENEVLDWTCKRIGEKCQEQTKDSISKSFLQGGVLGKYTDKLIVSMLPPHMIQDDNEFPLALVRQVRSFFNAVANEAVKKLVLNETEQKIKKASLQLLDKLSKICKPGKGGRTAIEAIKTSSIIAEAHINIIFLVKSYIPEVERICKHYEESKDISPSQLEFAATISNLPSVVRLKMELIDVLGDALASAVATILSQNIGAEVNRTVTKKINSVGQKLLRDTMKTNETRVKFLKQKLV